MVNDRYMSQRDPAWNRLNLPSTNLSVDQWGCTIASICNLVLEAYGVRYTPAQARLDFLYNSLGEVIWHGLEKINFLKSGAPTRKFPPQKNSNFLGHLDFIERIGHNLTNKEYQQKKDPNTFFLVRLNQNPYHWVFLKGWGAWYWPYFLAVDPFTCHPITKQALIRRYPKNLVNAYVVIKRS